MVCGKICVRERVQLIRNHVAIQLHIERCIGKAGSAEGIGFPGVACV